jgi:hypothetical protein
VLCGNNGFEYYLFGPGRHELKDSLIFADAVQPFYLQDIDPNGQCRLDAANVLVINTGSELKWMMITANTLMRGKNIMLSGIGIRHNGELLELSDSIIGGRPVPDIFIKDFAVWRPSNNLYALGQISVNNNSYSQNNFGDYQKYSGDTSSIFLSAK